MHTCHYLPPNLLSCLRPKKLPNSPHGNHLTIMLLTSIFVKKLEFENKNPKTEEEKNRRGFVKFSQIII